MKNNMFMALTTTALNAFIICFTPLLADTDVRNALISIGSLASPFIAIVMLRLYIKMDDPPELIRQVAGLKASIRVCRKHLKEKGCSDEFYAETRRKMEGLQYKLQNARADFEANRVHVITPFNNQGEG